MVHIVRKNIHPWLSNVYNTLTLSPNKSFGLFSLFCSGKEISAYGNVDTLLFMYYNWKCNEKDLNLSEFLEENELLKHKFYVRV